MASNVDKNFAWPNEISAVNWTGMGVDSTKSWARLLTADTGMKVRVAPEFDTVNRFRWLGLGLFQFTAGNSSETSQALMADLKYAVRDGGPIQIRACWSHSKNNAGFFTRGDSRIKTPHDIKPGTRIVNMTYVASQRIVDGLLAWAGLTRNDITWVDAANSVENYKLVVDGKADLGFSFPVSPTMAEAAKNPLGISWIELNAQQDPEGARRFQTVDPLISFGVIPDGGVASAAGKWGTEGIILEITTERTDAALVYNLAKWWDLNYERYKGLHADNRFRTRAILLQALEHTFVPCHDGLIAYLKDLGLWTKAHDIRQKENRDLVDTYCRAYREALDLADDKAVNVDPQHAPWQKLWADYKTEHHIPPVRLFAGLPKVK